MHLHQHSAGGDVKRTWYGPDGSKLTLETFPECPRCGAPWTDDHIDGGHCPGRPQGCTCDHDFQSHKRVGGCWPRRESRPCPCVYGWRPTDYSGRDWENRED